MKFARNPESTAFVPSSGNHLINLFIGIGQPLCARRMYLRWSARVAQFLFNQACQFSPFWLTGCTPQRRTLIGCLFQPITVPQASCTLGGCILIHPPSNWFSQRVLNWHTFWAVCSVLLNTSSYIVCHSRVLCSCPAYECPDQRPPGCKATRILRTFHPGRFCALLGRGPVDTKVLETRKFEIYSNKSGTATRLLKVINSLNTCKKLEKLFKFRYAHPME